MLNFTKGLNQSLKTQTLPDYGVLYFDHLISEFDHLLMTASEKDEFKNYANELKEKRKVFSKLSWNDLYSLELLISRVLPKERLLREVWRLRLRYRDVVGLKQYENYLAAKTPDLTPEELNEKDYKADIEYLLTEIYLRYVTTPYNEKLRNNISQKVTGLILCGLAVVVCISFFFDDVRLESLGPATLLLVLFIGAMGGLLSMQQRYQSISREGDPVDNISLLQQSWSRLFMPAVSGAIFSGLLYMIIVGKLVEGDLFPKLNTPSGSSNETNSLLDAIKKSNPKEVADYAKLVVWSFLAGFAERFVPDTLSRFLSTREISAKGTS